MAYGLRKISPLDLKPSVSLGVAVPFRAASVFTPVYSSKEQTKYNLINFLLTNPGERVFNPSFGAGLRSKLFEQIERPVFEEIEQSLTTQIENTFPQIQVSEIKVVSDPDTNSISVKLSYRLRRSNESDNVALMIEIA